MKRRLFAVIAVILLAVLMISGLGRSMVTQAGQIYDSQKINVVVSSDDGNVNFRSGPGLEYGVIQPIYNGTQLYITALTQNSYDGLVWGQTYYNGRNGWISIQNTAVYSIDNASTACYDVRVTMPDYIYLRQGPGSEFASLYRPYEGQILRIDQTMVNMFDGRPWGRTTINGMQGWVSLNWTYRDNSQVYNQAKDVVFRNNIYNVYVQIGDDATWFNNGPGSSYQLLAWLPNRTALSVVSLIDNSQDGMVWGETQYGGTSGWIPMNYTVVTDIYGACNVSYNVNVDNSANLKLRGGPGTEYPLQYYNDIPNGTTLTITQTTINNFDGRPWGKTSYNGTAGWVSLNWTYRALGQ